MFFWLKKSLKMVRAPCCDKSGLKKGPWSADEDRILIAYIRSYGHSNWRALPKQAGLMRCGKSCRLRWTNYLSPDIKRGNFSREEEQTIISLHEKLGNRWSAIAARLPGRTDNEIKNVWHTHIKKRLPAFQESKRSVSANGTKDVKTVHDTKPGVSPSCSYSDVTSSATDFSTVSRENSMDESSWSELLTIENHEATADIAAIVGPLRVENLWKDDDDEDGTNFWLRMLMEAGDLTDFPEI